jgi:uncharacterized protein
MDAGAKIEELLKDVRQDTDILALFLFGSVVRDEQSPSSDIDFCLALMPKGGVRDPNRLSRKRLEYLGKYSLDIHIFQQLPIYIRKRIIGEGRILFVRDEGQLYELALRTVQAFEDFRQIYTSYLEEVAGGRP